MTNGEVLHVSHTMTARQVVFRGLHQFGGTLVWVAVTLALCFLIIRIDAGLVGIACLLSGLVLGLSIPIFFTLRSSARMYRNPTVMDLFFGEAGIRVCLGPTDTAITWESLTTGKVDRHYWLLKQLFSGHSIRIKKSDFTAEQAQLFEALLDRKNLLPRTMKSGLQPEGMSQGERKRKSHRRGQK